MSAAELLRAAETLRGLVSALDPWGEDAEEAGYETWAEHHRAKAYDPEPVRVEHAYIATMHPGVGLLLAGWLESQATHASEVMQYAYDIAHLINGEV